MRVFFSSLCINGTFVLYGSDIKLTRYELSIFDGNSMLVHFFYGVGRFFPSLPSVDCNNVCDKKKLLTNARKCDVCMIRLLCNATSLLYVVPYEYGD